MTRFAFGSISVRIGPGVGEVVGEVACGDPAVPTVLGDGSIAGRLLLGASEEPPRIGLLKRRRNGGHSLQLTVADPPAYRSLEPHRTHGSSADDQDARSHPSNGPPGAAKPPPASLTADPITGRRHRNDHAPPTATPRRRTAPNRNDAHQIHPNDTTIVEQNPDLVSHRGAACSTAAPR